MSDEITGDVVVIGGGLAGLTSAVRASELGLRAVVLEQGDAERYLCNSRLSGGILHLAYHELRRPREVLHAAITKATAGQADDGLAQALAADAGRLIEWLRDHGARFMHGGTAEWERWVLAPPRPLRAGLEWQGRGPDVLLCALVEQLVRKGGTIERGVRATGLEPRPDSIAVVGRQGGREARWLGKAVVIADGGFQADAELFRAHIGPRPDLVKQRGAANSRGDGLRMALALGAAATRLDRFYGHLLAQEAMTSDRLWPYPQLDSLAVAAIIVAREGGRMFDEGSGGVELANRLARSADPASAAIVFDEAIWEGPGRTSRIPTNPNLELGGATIYRADTLGALAAKLDMNADRLARTVAEYNDALTAGRTGELTPARRTDLHQAWPIRHPPFGAVRICAGITHTMGGIAIDDHARVLRAGGGVIERLYAAGTSIGGIEGGGTIGGYVGGLSTAGIFGLRAAEHAAAHVAR